MSIKEKLSRNSNFEHDDHSFEPYVGPRPFKRDKKDQFRFFGRNAETDEIVSLITSHRLILVYAQSGAGKTSIFNAQIIHRLEDHGFEVLPMARVQVTSATQIRSKDDNGKVSSQIKNLYIYNALQSLSPEIDPQSLINSSLFEFLDDYFPNQKDENREMRPQVLIFDQLEELISLYPDDWMVQQKDFFEQVADSLDNNPILRIVFIIREDFLAQLDPFKNRLPEKLRPHFRLEQLRKKEAVLAIKGPLTNIIDNLAEDEARHIEDEIDELVNDLLKIYVENLNIGLRQIEGEFVEPIQLQVVCRRWWLERQSSKSLGNKNTLKDLANVDTALEDFYEDAILSASEQTGVHKREIRRWFEEKLITSSGTRSIIHRGRNSTGGIDNKVADILESKYLIRREWRSGASWYELTHDRLISPIRKSNKTWREKHERGSKKYLPLKIMIPIIAAVMVMSVLIAYNYGQQHPSQTISVANGYGFIKKWSANLTGNGQFYSPLAIDVDSSGNVYVVDSGNNRVQKFDSKGTFITKWGTNGTGNGQFSSPEGIAVDSSGNVYVADTFNYRVQKFDNKGTFISTWGTPGTDNGQFNSPVGVKVDSSGNVYVVDSTDNNVQKFDSKGTFITKWGTNGTGNGQFRSPEDIAVDSSGNVYVTDYGNNRVQKFDSKGTFITKWGTNGTGNGQFYYPLAVDVGSSGNVYVTDGNYRVQKFDSNGTFITKWGSQGTGLGQFNNPLAVDVDSSGNVYVTDNSNNNVQKFDSNGTFITKWGASLSGDGQFHTPLGIVLDSRIGAIYVVDKDNHRIQKLDNNGTFITKWGSQGTGNGQFSYPFDIAVDSSSNVYVTDNSNNNVQKFDSNGTFITKWGSQGTGLGQFSNSSGIAVDSSGNVYVADYGNHRVQKFDSKGTFISTWGTYGTGNGQFNSPQGIAVDSSGNVYVTDSGNYRVQKFDSKGTFISTWGTYGTGNGQFSFPEGIEVDSAGYIYVSDINSHNIQKFNSTGTFITAWGKQGTTNGDLQQPYNLVIDPETNYVYTTDSINNRIEVFSPSSYISLVINNNKP
jgi:tripartite motif-containing protein 71